DAQLGKRVAELKEVLEETAVPTSDIDKLVASSKGLKDKQSKAKKAATKKTIVKKRQRMRHQRGGAIHGRKREPGAKKKVGRVCADHAGVDYRMNHLRVSSIVSASLQIVQILPRISFHAKNGTRKSRGRRSGPRIHWLRVSIVVLEQIWHTLVKAKQVTCQMFAIGWRPCTLTALLCGCAWRKPKLPSVSGSRSLR
ncbi:unnamed protein product, partial [Symbiodinium sp. CCMP2456]